MPRSGFVYQPRASAHEILSTVYAIEKRTKLIGAKSRASDPIDGTKLALLLTEAKLHTVFEVGSDALTNTDDGHPSAAIHNQFQLCHRPKIAEPLSRPRLSEA
ncbi:MAG TPA: hypothetical protein VK582_24270 [Pyrinomonadaceae bacterium]|nr:hypothetical protein [Pyrinomonadaceae bacterium]